jgi:hypothetical protein
MSQSVDADGGAARRPLVVDLDGTLIATDTLWECLVVLLRQRPWDVARSPLWCPSMRPRCRIVRS